MTDYPDKYNAAAGLIAPNLEQGRASKPAFIDPERQITYGELDLQCSRMANLLNNHGIRREDRVAMIALDTVDFPIIFLGAIKSGVVPVAINTLLGTDQYQFILGDSRAKALFVSAPLLPTVMPALDRMESLQQVFVVGGDETAGAGYLDFASTLSAQSEQFDTVDTSVDEVAFWLYSSGSTGMPKGVPHVHSSMMETARLYAQGVLGVEQQDVVFSAAKLFFAYGLGNSLSFPMSVGATTILYNGRPTPDVIFDILKSHNPTLFFGAPTLYAALLAYPDCGPSLSSDRLRLCISAGEALPADIGVKWKTLFGVDILDGVGTTELLHIFLSNHPDDIHYGTSGRPVPGYEVRLVDENGEDVATGEIGELVVKGDTAAIGYWNNRRKTRATFRGEWTVTGDKYTCDGDGLFTYCGRTDDMFKVSGIWLSPFEVESALISHPSVLESAVVPYEDDDGLTKARAFVVLNEGESEQGKFELLKEYVKDAIGKWKYPREIRFVDSLPKTATGKIQRFKLRD